MALCFQNSNMLGRKTLLLLCIAGCTLEATKSTCNGEVAPEKILTGPDYQIGDYAECLYRREAKYCLAEVQLKAANCSSHFWTNIEELGKIPTHFRRDLLHVGLCVSPQSAVRAISEELEDSLRDAANRLGVIAEVRTDQRACQTKQQQRSYHAVDLLTGFGILVITVLVVCGTGHDAFRTLQEHKVPVETKCIRLLSCFSLIANFKKLCALSRSEARSEFRAIHGFRTLTVCTFILPHVFIVLLNGPIRNPEWVEKSYLNIFWASIYNSSVYLAVFFCIGGFLLSYLFLRELDGRSVFKWSDFFMVVIHRYLRLTPLYVVVIAFVSSWHIHMAENPVWNTVIGTEVKNCRHHWWLNLLYLNNYFEVEEMCMPHTWYLAADFQCHVVSILLLILVWKHPQRAKSILAGVLFASICISFLLTYIEGLDPLLLLFPETVRHLLANKTFRRAHITFQHNFGAYFVGVIFGYIYHNIKRTGVKCRKMGHFLVWIIALTVLCSIHLVSTIFYQPSYQPDALTASLYACTYRIIIAAATGTILIGCALGHGGIINNIASSGLFQLLGHLSYCVYLIHIYVLQVQTLGTMEPIDVSGFWVMRSAVCAIVTSFSLAAVLNLLVETPSAAILKWILTGGSRLRRDTRLRNQHSD